LKVFEIGDSFFGNEPGQQIIQASGILSGQFYEKNAFDSQRPVDIFDCKAVVLESLSEIGILTDSLMLKRKNLPEYFHPGRSGILSQGPKNNLAIFGELHPRVIEFYGLKGPVMAFEILIDNISISKSKKLTRKPSNFSEYQPVERDFSFVVDSHCEVESIRKAILNVEKIFLSDVFVFDIFEGEKAELQLGSNKKSVAFTVRLQPVEGTFTESDLEIISSKIIESVKNSLKATLRS
jgi:phenylalanyl-tRNA synthetase beta chain